VPPPPGSYSPSYSGATRSASTTGHGPSGAAPPAHPSSARKATSRTLTPPASGISTATAVSVRDPRAAVDSAQRGLHDRERGRRPVRDSLAAADHQRPPRADDLAGHHEPPPGRGRQEVDRVRRREDGGVRRHDAERGVPARAVQDGGDGTGVQEPVLLGEPV